MSERQLDDNYDDWKPGDRIVWKDDKEGETIQIAGIDRFNSIISYQVGKGAAVYGMFAHMADVLRVKED